jgi:hypothetical protein
VDQSGVPIVILGFLLGVKHSLDVDHLAAVSTLVAGTGNTVRSMVVGMYWGLGHSLSILILGGAIILLDLKFPPEVALGLEGLVGVMLIFLGGRVFYRLARGGVFHVHAHGHGDRVHLHTHIHDPGLPHPGREDALHHHPTPLPQRSSGVSFLVGMVHGLAGSAGLTLLLLPTIPTRLAGVMYLVVFGAGSVCGMAVSTLVLSLPFRALGSLGSPGMGRRIGTAISMIAGLVSLGVGGVLLRESFLPLLNP